MEKFLKKIGCSSIVISLFFSILGIMIACNPNTTFKMISYILGTILTIYGVIKILEYLKMKEVSNIYSSELSHGMIAILLGVVVMLCSNMIETLLRILMGIWIIYSALIRMKIAIELQKIDLNSKINLIIIVIATVMLIGGIYIIATPGIIMMTIGIMMTVYGVMDIIEEIILMKNIKNIM